MNSFKGDQIMPQRNKKARKELLLWVILKLMMIPNGDGPLI
jgi:hypothetical protein